jgi:hypothetical protein
MSSLHWPAADVPLERYGGSVRRHRSLLAACVVAGTVVGVLLGKSTTTYVASASVLLPLATLQPGVAEGDIGKDGLTPDTESHIATSTPVLAAARTASGIDEPLLQISDRLTVDAPPLTRVLTLRFSASSEAKARAAAAAAATTYLRERNRLVSAQRSAGLATLDLQIQALQTRLAQAAVTAGGGSAADGTLGSAMVVALKHEIRVLRNESVGIKTSGSSQGTLLRPPQDARLHTRGGGIVPTTSGALIGLLIGLVLTRLRPDYAGDARDLRLSGSDEIARTDSLATVTLGPPTAQGTATPDRELLRVRNVVVAGGGGVTVVCGGVDPGPVLELAGGLAASLARLEAHVAVVTRPGQLAPSGRTVTQLPLPTHGDVGSIREQQYDHVIVAVPGFPDPEVCEVAAAADRTLVVNQHRRTTMTALSSTLGRLRLVGANVVGTVRLMSEQRRLGLAPRGRRGTT